MSIGFLYMYGVRVRFENIIDLHGLIHHVLDLY